MTSNIKFFDMRQAIQRAAFLISAQRTIISSKGSILDISKYFSYGKN